MRLAITLTPSNTPSNTATITPSLTRCPSITPSPNPVCPEEFVVSQSTTTIFDNGIYLRQYMASGQSINYGYVVNNSFIPGTAPDGNNYAVFELYDGGDYNTVFAYFVGSSFLYFEVIEQSPSILSSGSTFVGGRRRLLPSLEYATYGGVRFPTAGLKTTQIFGDSAYITYPILCPTPTATPTKTATPSNTATQTNTSTPSITQTSSQTATPTNTQTNTGTPSITQTSTPSQTASITPTNTATQTITPTNTQTSTQTNTPSITPTKTTTPTKTATPTNTPTVSPTSNSVCDNLLNITQTGTESIALQGNYNRITSYTGGTFNYGYLTGSTGNFTPGQAPDGNYYPVYELQSGSTYSTLIWNIVSGSTNRFQLIVYTGGTSVLNRPSGLPQGTYYTTSLTTLQSGVSYPRPGTHNFILRDWTFTYPSVCATPTATPTNTQTSTPTNTQTNTPSNTQTGTPATTPPSTPASTNTPTQTQTQTATPLPVFLLNNTAGLTTGYDACVDYANFNRVNFYASSVNGGTIHSGTYLYTNQAQIGNPAFYIPDGYYSNGTTYWYFQNGTTGDAGSACVAASPTPTNTSTQTPSNTATPTPTKTTPITYYKLDACAPATGQGFTNITPGVANQRYFDFVNFVYYVWDNTSTTTPGTIVSVGILSGQAGCP